MTGLILIVLVAIIALTLLFGAAVVLRGLAHVFWFIALFVIVAAAMVIAEDFGQALWIVASVAGALLAGLLIFVAVERIRAHDERNRALGLTGTQGDTYRSLLKQRRFSEAEIFLSSCQPERTIDDIELGDARSNTIARLAEAGMTPSEAEYYMRLVEAGDLDSANDFYARRTA